MRVVILVSLIFPLAILPGCRKPAAVETAARGSAPASAAALPAPAETPARLAARAFERVHFAYDSSALDTASQAALREAADILLAHRELRVEVQGHCDERGTTEYNLALGNARAAAVRSALAAYGVGSGQVATVSFGEERPVALGAGEVAWAQNRRAEFRLLTGLDHVRGTVD